MRKAMAWISTAALVGLGCSGAGTREVSGRFSTTQAQNALVLAQSAQGQVFVSSVSASGTFHLSLPAGARYRLAMAQRTATGFALTSHILWHSKTGSHPFALVSTGPKLRLMISQGIAALDGSSDEGDGGEDDGISDDVEDGATCSSGEVEGDGDHDGGSSSDGSGGDGSGGGSSCDGGSGDGSGGSSGDGSGMDGGSSGDGSLSQGEGSTSGDVESGGDVKCDDGMTGDDDGSVLQCTAGDAGTVGGGGGSGATDAGTPVGTGDAGPL